MTYSELYRVAQEGGASEAMLKNIVQLGMAKEEKVRIVGFKEGVLISENTSKGHKCMIDDLVASIRK